MNSLIRRLALFAGVLSGLYAAYIGLISLNIYIGSDIVFQGMMLLEITEWLYSIVLENAIFFWVYAFTLFSLFYDGPRTAALFGASYVLLSALRYCVLMWLGYINLWASTVNYLPEMLQYAAILAICFACVYRFDRVYRVRLQGYARLGTECPSRLSLVYPHGSSKAIQDPFRAAALIMGFGFGVIGVIGRIILDVTIGAPSGIGEIFNMVLWYTIDILIGFAAYYAILLIVKYLARYEIKKENG